MLYAALTLWLAVIMFTAWGVHRLWSGLVKPRVVNSVLLPGTLVAQLGHVLGLLVTGNPVRNTALMGDDEQGEPKSDAPETQRIPVLGPILIGLLPLLACAVCLYVAARLLGGSVLGELSGGAALEVSRTLPTSLAAFWQLLHGCVDLMERVLNAIIHSDLPNWPTIVFLYLAVCLTVRMAPFEGNRRGAIGAIVLAGVIIGIVAALVTPVRDLVESSWPILSFAVGMLLFLLLLSLLVTGVVGLIRTLARKE
ncbi:MAG: hypothetical protein KKB50_14435 [Planctomycetes bacterium]|nr:hypothetical protein [Planctomycetota bacterium]